MRRYLVDGEAFEVRATSKIDARRNEPPATEAIVPACHRADWAATLGEDGLALEAWRIDPPRCAAAMIVDVGNSRSLPGSTVWRIDRFGGYPDQAALRVLLEAVVDMAVEDPRVLRLSLGLFARSADDRKSLAERCLSLGFRKADAARSYEKTLAIPLDGDEAALLQRMRPSGRRQVRNALRGPTEARPIHDPSMAARVDSLARMAMTRTGGFHRELDWGAVISFCEQNPTTGRLVGAFADDLDEPLVAFALGLRQGDHVEYNAAGSSRGEIKGAVGYGPAWELIKWAHSLGATWFDFGGVAKDEADRPETAGISRFKKHFGGEVIGIREEWFLEPRPLRGALGRTISKGVAGIKRIAGR